ncbi:MAG: DUF547 domain-containing protein [Planctomycetes bacterium]|nr:DUF547 domain-containing protein [Planctomycetota bacterium]
MRKTLILGLFTLLLATVPLRLWAGSKVTVGANVPAAQQVSIDRINHAAWDALLRKHCDQRGYVNYQAWHTSPADMQQLDQYLAHLSQANPAQSASPASKFAFWINAYNAVTIRGILREYPTSSIKNHQSIAFGYKIWDDLLLPVGGQNYSLNAMEHQVLRKMGDPRIHFAIVCASISCPPLLNQAYTAENLDAQLTYNAKRFFADPTKFAATSQGELKLSKILSWFASDFGPNQAAQLRTIAPYLPTQAAQSLANSGRARVSFLGYDWGLNDQATQSGSARR